VRIDLTGRTAIVTASTKGIGLATAKGFAAAGANVVINGRNQAGVDAALAARGVAMRAAWRPISARSPGRRY
jgi:NAD(P)-dependent dehydrogenase (short-subunit alcohol dehydrogenase family)